MKLKRIIVKNADAARRWLVKNGYDGLCSYECGCGVDGLHPCEEQPEKGCLPAHKVPDPERKGCLLYFPGKAVKRRNCPMSAIATRASQGGTQ